MTLHSLSRLSNIKHTRSVICAQAHKSPPHFTGRVPINDVTAGVRLQRKWAKWMHIQWATSQTHIISSQGDIEPTKSLLFKLTLSFCLCLPF